MAWHTRQGVPSECHRSPRLSRAARGAGGGWRWRCGASRPHRSRSRCGTPRGASRRCSPCTSSATSWRSQGLRRRARCGPRSRLVGCPAPPRSDDRRSPPNAAYGVCEIGPAHWWFRPSVEGVELIGPLPCVARAAQRPNESGTFFYRQSEDGRFARYRCVDHPEQPRELTLRVEEQRRPLPFVSTPWSERAQSLRRAGPWVGLALLGLGIVALVRRRHPDARSLQRRWRACAVEADGIATFGDGESVRLPPELSSRLSPGAPLLIDSAHTGAATYRGRPWVEADAVWPGTESSLRERVEANACRRWQLVALSASLTLALAASFAGTAQVARWRRPPDVVEMVGASAPALRPMEPPDDRNEWPPDGRYEWRPDDRCETPYNNDTVRSEWPPPSDELQ